MNIPSITWSITARCPSKYLYMDICQLPPRMGLLKKPGFKEEREKGGGGGGSFESKRDTKKKKKKFRNQLQEVEFVKQERVQLCCCIAEEFGRERSIWEEFNRQLLCIFARWLSVCLKVSRVRGGDGGCLWFSLSLNPPPSLLCIQNTLSLVVHPKGNLRFF